MDGAVERVLVPEADCVLETGADRVCVGDVDDVFELDIDEVPVLDEVVVLVLVAEPVVVRLCITETDRYGEDDDDLLSVADFVDDGDRQGVSVIRAVGVSKLDGRVLRVPVVVRVDVLLDVALVVGIIALLSSRRPGIATSISIRAPSLLHIVCSTPYSLDVLLLNLARLSKATTIENMRILILGVYYLP